MVEAEVSLVLVLVVVLDFTDGIRGRGRWGKSDRRLHSAPNLFCQPGFLQDALIEFRDGTRRFQRQIQRERRPFPLLARRCDPSAVMMHDEKARHEMDAELARRVGSNHERIKQTTQRLR